MISLHPHGDGTYHTMQGKEPGRVEHDSFGAAVAHMAKHHAEGSHMHIEDTEDGYQSHHKSASGKVSGPHDHANLQECKRAMTQFFNEEEHEG